MDRLRLVEVQCPVRLGVTQAQRAKKQVLLLDLELETDVTKAAARDDFRLAVDYWAVENSVREALESREWQLVEAAAEHAASVVLSQQAAVASVTVRARKKPRVNKNRREVVVELVRSRKGAVLPDRLQVLGVDCRARVGVPEDERAKPQKIVLDLELRADFSKCAKADDYRLAVDSQSVASLARETAESRPWKLVEALAARVAEVVLGQERRAAVVAVRAHKSPYVMPKTREVLVELSRKR